MRLFIELSYDGSPFHGWQRQPESISVQQEIETLCLSFLVRAFHLWVVAEPIRVFMRPILWPIAIGPQTRSELNGIAIGRRLLGS